MLYVSWRSSIHWSVLSCEEPKGLSSQGQGGREVFLALFPMADVEIGHAERSPDLGLDLRFADECTVDFLARAVQHVRPRWSYRRIRGAPQRRAPRSEIPVRPWPFEIPILARRRSASTRTNSDVVTMMPATKQYERGTDHADQGLVPSGEDLELGRKIRRGEPGRPRRRDTVECPGPGRRLTDNGPRGLFSRPCERSPRARRRVTCRGCRAARSRPSRTSLAISKMLLESAL